MNSCYLWLCVSWIEEVYVFGSVSLRATPAGEIMR
jgi:hypothetical protein